MKLRKLLRKIFPRPNIPQKRYIAILAVVTYYLLKLYVANTPSKEDDSVPDDFNNTVQLLLS
jgi:hypothetical protein